MVNNEKIQNLIKEKGVSRLYICTRLGKHKSFLVDVFNHRSSLKPDQLEVVAEILGTTVDYLTDKTDDPSIKKETAVSDDLAVQILSLINSLSPADREKALSYLDFLANREE